MKKQFIYGLLSLTVLSGAGLSSCSSEEDFAGPKGQKVMLSITASKDAQTRTSFEETEDGLLCKWTEGDKLLVTNTSGQRLGVITLQGEGGVTTGLFRGPVTLDGNQTVNLFYLGNGKAIPETLTENAYTLDLSAQDGTFASLAANDFMHQEADVKLLNGEATGSVMMDRRVAEGHFDLQLPGGLQLKAGDVVTITQPEGTFHVAPKIKYGTGGSVVGATDNGTLTITKTEDGNDLYVTIFPQTLTPTFTIKKDGSIYTATLGSHDWVQSTYVSNADGSGVAVADWTKTDLPTDPGDLDNWGGDVSYPTLQGSGSLTKIGKSSDAWCSNERSLQDFGFAAPYTFPYNAIKNGLLTSNSWTNGEEARFFQWGRWLGFPKYVENAKVTMLSYASSGTVAYARGVNQNTYQSYYCWDMDSRPTYAYSVAWANTGMEKQQAVNSSIIYLCADKDYLKSAYKTLSWEQRSGNPCPDGYRIPTAEEMYIFVPEKGLDSDGQFNGSHAEVKTVNGQKYAVKWTVNSSNKSVSIACAETTLDEVDTNSSVFNGAKSIELYAKGFMYSEDAGVGLNETLTDGTYVGGYWTSSMYTEEAGNGLGVMVYIKGSTCQVSLESIPMSWGLCIMPIKDSKAKATPIKPWFPLGY